MILVDVWGNSWLPDHLSVIFGSGMMDVLSWWTRLRPIQKLRLGDPIAIQARDRRIGYVVDTIQFQGGPAGFSL